MGIDDRKEIVALLREADDAVKKADGLSDPKNEQQQYVITALQRLSEAVGSLLDHT